MEGFSRKDDRFPEEWFKPLKFGQKTFKFLDFFGGVSITPNIANQMLDDYYDEREWDLITGNPSEGKVKELGLKKFM
jgi:aldehyde:ferredoxin oxidoreductase